MLIQLIYPICRASNEAALKIARQDQIYDKEHFLAVQAARDRAEFERVLRYALYLLYQ